jgi:RNA polymerase primary sigma factor
MDSDVDDVRRLAEAEIQTTPLGEQALNVAEPTATSPEEQAVERVALQEIAPLVHELVDARTLDILRRRAGVVGPPETLEQLGSAYGVTRERIRQIETAGLKRLRDAQPAWAVSPTEPAALSLAPA